MEKTLRMNMLFDFYGPLLTQRQQDIYEMYFGDDLSLSEIAEELEISRQAVYDILKRTSGILEELEEKLGLLRKFETQQSVIKSINGELVALKNSLTLLGLSEQVAIIEALQNQITQTLTDS